MITNCLIGGGNSRTVNLLTYAFAFLIIIVGLYIPFYYAHFGINLADEPYQIMLARDYTHSPGAPLSGWIATQWAHNFGWGLFSMRTLAIILNEIGLLACGFYMYKLTRHIVATMIITGVSAYLMSFYLMGVVYGWDSTSNCFILLTLAATISAMNSNSLWRWVVVGILTALAALSRIPNCVIVFIVTLIVLIRQCLTLKKVDS